MSKHYAKEIDGFLHDVRDHKITIYQDNDLFRHIRLGRKDSGTYYYCLTTWPGYLCISGDMGCAVYSRIDDMFRFFRTGEDREWAYKGIAINPGYWTEKVQTESRFGKDKEFDVDGWNETVIELMNEAIESAKEDGLSEEDEKNLKEEVEWQVLNPNRDSLDIAMRDALDFSYDPWRSDDYCGDDPIRPFSEIWDCGGFIKESHHCIWRMCAITWGITQYDNLKKELEEKRAKQ